MLIKDNVALVTGGASGMGLATALHLQKLGAHVVILDNDSQRLMQHEKTHGLTCYKADVTNEAEIEAVFKQLHDHNTVPRIVVQCAGIAPAKKILGKDGPHDFALFKKTMDINVNGLFVVMKTAASYLKTLPIQEGSRGVLIHTASIAAFEGQIGQVAYSASKGAIVAMTLPAARELATHAIRVMTIAPGLIETPLLTGISDEVKASLASSIPFPKRLGSPHEFAKLVAAIIENDYLNGSTIRMDGGLRMGEK